MLKTTIVAIACSAATASTMLVFAGRTVHSSPFQMDIPYGSGLKVTPDPANIWSWHHTFANYNETVEVLVDVDGNRLMDTEHPWLRVMITDIEFVHPAAGEARAWIRDTTGRRFAVGTGGFQSSGPVMHCALATPIVLPVGSSLSVEMSAQGQNGCEVHLIGHVVNL